MEPQKALKKLGIELPKEFSQDPNKFVMELYHQKDIDAETVEKYHDMVYLDFWRFSNLVEKARKYTSTPLARRIQSVFL